MNAAAAGLVSRELAICNKRGLHARAAARFVQTAERFDAEITVDLRVGGELVFTGTDPDEPITMTCTILQLEPPTLLEHTHPAPGSVLRWELEPADTGCILRLAHTVPDVDAAVENGFLVGLQISLSRLEPALAGDPVPWDWDAFATARAHYATLGLATDPEDDR